MAYLVDLVHRCHLCRERRAVVELRNCFNAELGQFCRSCGKRVLAEQQRREDAPATGDNANSPSL